MTADRLNDHHYLLSFRVIAREGSIMRARDVLRIFP